MCLWDADASDGEGKCKRSKGETASGKDQKHDAPATGALKDDESLGDALTQPVGKAPARTVKKKLFQKASPSAQENTHGNDTDSAMLGRVDGSDGIFGFAETSNQSMDDKAAEPKKRKHDAAEHEQQLSKQVSTQKSDGGVSELAEASGDVKHVDSDASPGQLDNQSEKENESNAPSGKQLVGQQAKGKGRRMPADASPLTTCR